MAIHLRAPGSASNLGPGFDCLGLALTIYNRITVREVSGSGVNITITGEGAGDLPEDDQNLFYSSAIAAAEMAGGSLPGLRVEMENRIPLVRGLGSSSTAIVAGISAANLLLGEPLGTSDLLNLATRLEGHPDNVSPCLLGGFTISALKDGSVEHIRALPSPELRAIVVVPHFEIRTEAARKALPDSVPHRDAVFNVGHASLVTAALIKADFQILRTAMKDRLHQPYRAHLVPGIEQVLDAAESSGALGACLSGAGPTLLAFTVDDGVNIKRAMLAAWKNVHIDANGYILQVDRDGVTAE
ncbi:MAG: homoserine kinase [Gemmatimonadetes bacterium]|nr:homoserine kinase [Gemmatimonadota bacterium]